MASVVEAVGLVVVLGVGRGSGTVSLAGGGGGAVAVVEEGAAMERDSIIGRL